MILLRRHVLCLLLLLLLSGASAPAAALESPEARLRGAISAGGMLRHLQALQRIADTNGGNRAAGTPGYDQSAAYVRQQLEAAGYDVRVQQFEFLYYAADVQQGQTLGAAPMDLAPLVMLYSPSTPSQGLEAPLALVAAAADRDPGCQASDYAGRDYQGTIALIQRGGCPFALKASRARDAGALAALIYNNEADPNAELHGTLGAADQASIPVAGITRAAAEALIPELSVEQLVVSLNLQTTTETRTTANIIAERPAQGPASVVMAGAHLDSVSEGPGLNDNGSGVALLLELALQLTREDLPTSNRLRFAFWGAEELGALGSHHYVNQLHEAERASILVYVNFDMVGSPNYGRFVYADNRAPLDLPGRRQTLEQLVGDYLREQQLDYRQIPVGDRSDHAPFAAAGIPVAGLFSGAEELKTTEDARRFGGSPGSAYDACYHRSCDTLDNVSLAALDELGDLGAALLLRLALPVAPVPADVPSARADSRDSPDSPVQRRYWRLKLRQLDRIH